jgi:hypothetical protein
MYLPGSVKRSACYSKKNGDLDISESRRLTGSICICRYYFFLAGAFAALAGLAIGFFNRCGIDWLDRSYFLVENRVII